MSNTKLIEKVSGKIDGVSYSGQVFWDKDNKKTFCKIESMIGGDLVKINTTSFSDAIYDLGKQIREYNRAEQIKNRVKNFILVPVGYSNAGIVSPHLGSYFLDVDDVWTNVEDEGLWVQEKLSENFWEMPDQKYVVVETELENLSPKEEKELNKIYDEALKEYEKFVVKRVKEMLSKRKK